MRMQYRSSNARWPKPLYRRRPALQALGEEVLGPDDPEVAPALNKRGTARQFAWIS